VAAIHGAGVRTQQEGPIGIAVQQGAYGAVFFFSEGVLQVSGYAMGLLGEGNGLAAYGARGVVGVHQGEDIGGEAQAEVFLGSEATCALLGGKGEKALQRFPVLDGVLHLPAPVPPLFGGGLGEIAAAKGGARHRGVLFSPAAGGNLKTILLPSRAGVWVLGLRPGGF